MIEHVSRPREVLEAAGRAVEGFPSARLYLETPCVEWILRNRVFWDFFYEHCSLFCEASLRTAVERSGFVVREVRHVFGGQYLWLEAEPGEASPRSGGERPGVAALCRGFAQDEARELARWRFRVEELWREGGDAIWGAGAKGTTFAHLLDPGRERIDCLVDVNPNKQGTFVAGTGHPIVPPEELAARGVRSAILMNPNYREESEGMLAALGVNVRLVE